MNKLQLIVRECMREIARPDQSYAMREVYDEVMECAIKDHMKRLHMAQSVTSIAMYN